MQYIERSILIATILVVAGTSAWAQHPHERLMERAHPTPVLDPTYDFEPMMVPLITGEQSFPSLFTNYNMIIAEDDPLPVQNESSIAINPTNPKNLLGSAVDYRNTSSAKAYYSMDGGITWNNVEVGYVRNGWRSSNDPSVAFDHLGRGYLCYGGFNREGSAQFGENGVFISMTDDGGASWGPKHVPVIIHTGQQTADSAFEDKYYVHVDTAASSPFRGRLYIPWKRVINSDSSTGIVIARSTDRGSTWLDPVAVSDRFPGTSEDTTFGQSFPLARTGPDGSVHLVWNSGTESAVRYARSTDGGATWTAPRIIHTYQSFGNKSEIAGQVNSRVKEVVRAEAYPTLTIDNTGGPNNGNLYLCWSADQVPNIYFSRSTDNGVTWSTPVTVHSNDRNDQFWPWVALDPTNGDVAVMYFDSRDDEANILVNTYVSLSTDGGLTWTDRRVGDAENDLRRNPFSGNTFAGDYSGCDFYNGMVYPSWVDMRNTTEQNMSDNDVYTAAINVRAPAAPDRFAARTIADAPTEIDLEWSAVLERSFGQPLLPADAMFILRREGVLVAELPLSTLSYRDTGLEEYRQYEYTLNVADARDTSATRTASAFAGGSRIPGVPQIVAVSGAEDGTLTVTTTLPTVRLDGTTRLVNLASVIATANGFTDTQSVAAADTGRTIDLVLQPNADGWYHVHLQCADSQGNVSPSSNTLIAFTGNLEWNTETFDTMPQLLRLSGSWDRTPWFAYSEPASLTDSPEGAYQPGARDTILLYPHRVVRNQDQRTHITLRVAAFVADRDSALIEYAWDQNGPWMLGKNYDETVYPRWSDTTKGDDAWLYDVIDLEGGSPTDTLWMRLRMRANISKQSDGLYVDDITVENVTSVAADEHAVIDIYPQPASTHLVVGLAYSTPVDRCTVISMNGTTATSVWTQQENTLVINVRDLAPGVYALRFQQGRTWVHRAIHIVR